MSDDDSDSSSFGSDSDRSWIMFSPITSSEDEDILDDSAEEGDIQDVPIPPPFHHVDSVSETGSSLTFQQSSSSEAFGYKLCGDNVDKSVKHRYTRSDMCNTASSIHYFHSYAAKNRISTGDLSEAAPSPPTMEAKQIALTLLPSVDDDATICTNIATLISRVLVEHLRFFEHSFDDAVIWHIPHRYSEQMKHKSNVVSIPLNTVKDVALWICLCIRTSCVGSL